MPTFKVRLERNEVLRVVADVEIIADTEEKAKAEAITLAEDDAIDDDWTEIDGRNESPFVTACEQVLTEAEKDEIVEYP